MQAAIAPRIIDIHIYASWLRSGNSNRPKSGDATAAIVTVSGRDDKRFRSLMDGLAPGRNHGTTLCSATTSTLT